ncbi:MAG: hypothetical protein KAJ35_00280 [Thermoplasmata archaeon]|nr:hypothetical protein [Thermoplasmata archaeon]
MGVHASAGAHWVAHLVEAHRVLLVAHLAEAHRVAHREVRRDLVPGPPLEEVRGPCAWHAPIH